MSSRVKTKAEAVKKRFARMGAGLGPPPVAEALPGNLKEPEHAPAGPAKRKLEEPNVQLNLRVPKEVKRRLRLLAARDGMTLSKLFEAALDLYEKEHGAAPD